MSLGTTDHPTRRGSTAGPPPADPPEGSDAGGPGRDGGRPGWWAASPGWARAVLVGGVVLALLMLGALGGAWAGRESATTYGPPAGSTDVAFLQDMSTHHRQAVQMAVWERSNTADPVLRQLAFDIESTQNQQVGRMEGWLVLWNEPTRPPDGMHMASMGMPSPTMPGMASEQDLERLRASTGPALDVVFLQLMLRHHEGGTGMLASAVSGAQVPAVQTLAVSMLASQTAEATTMREMLAARGAAPLPGGAGPVG